MTIKNKPLKYESSILVIKLFFYYAYKLHIMLIGGLLIGEEIIKDIIIPATVVSSISNIATGAGVIGTAGLIGE